MSDSEYERFVERGTWITKDEHRRFMEENRRKK
jgi:hypothetical protein